MDQGQHKSHWGTLKKGVSTITVFKNKSSDISEDDSPSHRGIEKRRKDKVNRLPSPARPDPHHQHPSYQHGQPTASQSTYHVQHRQATSLTSPQPQPQQQQVQSYQAQQSWGQRQSRDPYAAPNYGFSQSPPLSSPTDQNLGYQSPHFAQSCSGSSHLNGPAQDFVNTNQRSAYSYSSISSTTRDPSFQPLQYTGEGNVEASIRYAEPQTLAFDEESSFETFSARTMSYPPPEDIYSQRNTQPFPPTSSGLGENYGYYATHPHAPIAPPRRVTEPVSYAKNCPHGKQSNLVCSDCYAAQESPYSS